MTKDSGIASTGTPNADWTTSDVSAGRLVSGTLSTALGVGEQVAVYSNGTLIGYATVAAGGTTWEITDTTGYSANWTYTAKVVDGSGNAGPVATQAVTTDLLAAAPVITAVSNGSNVTSGTGNVTGTSTSAITSISGTGEVGDTVYVYDNSSTNLVGTAVVGAGGTWTLSGLNLDKSGSNAFMAVQVDTNGNVSALSNSHTVTLSINLATNGDFSSGATGFTSGLTQYTTGNGNIQDSTNCIWYNTASVYDVDNTFPTYAYTGGTVNLTGSGAATDANNGTSEIGNQTGTAGTLTWTSSYGNVYNSTVNQYNNPDGAMTGNVLMANAKNTDGYGRIWQENLTVVAGQKYTMTFDYMHNGAFPVVFFGDTYAEFDTYSYEFGHLTATFTAATSGTIQYGIAIHGSGTGNASSSGDFAVDNIKLVQNATSADGTLSPGGFRGATSGADNLTYTSGTLDTIGGGDTITATSTGLQTTLANGGRIIGGSGVDTLKLAAGTTLDLTAITSNQTVKPIQEVEVFEMQGTSTLSMSANDVLSLGGANLSGYSFTSGALTSVGKVQFVVNGTGTDTLNLRPLLSDGNGGNTGLGGAWSMDGTVSIGGTSYNVYNHSTTQAQVLVKSTVTTVNMLTSPIMLDLNQDGVFSTQQVAMDVNSDGHMDLTTWAGKADGVLVLDQGGDRKVTNVSEYAFTQYGGKTDLEGLRAGFDTNGDGVLDANDARFGEFAVWQDANGDGVSDAGEVKTLAELGITSINLTSNGQTDASQAGMLVHGTTTAQTANGMLQVADAEFTYQTLQEKPMTLELQVPVESLPGEPTQQINAPQEGTMTLEYQGGPELLVVAPDGTELQTKPAELPAELQDLAANLLGTTPEQLAEAVTPLLEGAQDLLASTDLTTLTLLGLNQLQLSLDNLGASVADLSNGVNDVLSLQLDDLLTLPTAADGTRQLQIVGEAGDSVTLDQLLAETQNSGTWSQSGTTTQNGHTFNVYQYSGDQTLQVLIDQQILQSNVQLS